MYEYDGVIYDNKFRLKKKKQIKYSSTRFERPKSTNFTAEPISNC